MSLSRRRFLLVSAAAVSSVAALSSACAPTPPSAPTVAPAMAPAEPSTLNIGVLLPYTESSIGVDIGLNQKRAADLYLKQRGGALGGRPVHLVYSAESVESAINTIKAQTLVNKEKVDLLMGGASAEAANVLRSAADAAKLVYIATNATTTALTRDSRYVFRTSAEASQLSAPLAAWASSKGQHDFFVCGVDDTFGSECTEAFVTALAKSGGSATARSVFAGGSDAGKLVSSIRAQPSMNVFAALYTDDAEAFLNEWARQDLPAAGYRLFGPGPLTDEAVLAQVKGAATGVTTALFWSPDLDSAENKALVEAFPREYIDDDTGAPVSLSGYAVEMWDAIAALDRTIGAAGNGDALVAALEGVSFNSPRGTFAFSKASHEPVQDIYIRQVMASPAGTLRNAVVGKL